MIFISNIIQTIFLSESDSGVTKTMHREEAETEKITPWRDCRNTHHCQGSQVDRTHVQYDELSECCVIFIHREIYVSLSQGSYGILFISCV